MKPRWILQAFWLVAGLIAGPAAWTQPATGLTVSNGPIVQPADAQPSARGWLNLRELAEAALATHPLLQASRLQVQAAQQDIKVAQLQQWPTVSMVAESNTGNTASTPSRLLRLDQTVWDSGRIASRITETRHQSALALSQEQLQRHELLLQVVNAWQGLIAAQARLRVAQQTLLRLQFYKEQMVRRVQAQASATIDLELVEARVLQTQVELSTAQTSVRLALKRLEELTGQQDLSRRGGDVPSPPPLQATSRFVLVQAQTDWANIVEQSPSLVRARQERELAATRLGTKKAEQWPQVYVRYDKPLWNSTVHHITQPTVFAGLRYTPGAGFSGMAEIEALVTRLQSQEVVIDAARRDIRQSIQNDLEEFSTSRERITAIEQSVEGSERVLESYLRQFQANRKSWLDVLNSARELAQNQYGLAEAHAGMLGALHRLQVRTGELPALP